MNLSDRECSGDINLYLVFSAIADIVGLVCVIPSIIEFLTCGPLSESNVEIVGDIYCTGRREVVEHSGCITASCGMILKLN